MEPFAATDGKFRLLSSGIEIKKSTALSLSLSLRFQRAAHSRELHTEETGGLFTMHNDASDAQDIAQKPEIISYYNATKSGVESGGFGSIVHVSGRLIACLWCFSRRWIVLQLLLTLFEG